MRRALTEAAGLLADPICRTLLAEFNDANGRPLTRRLEDLGMDLQPYLRVVVFTDDAGHPSCGKGSFALTAPRSRVVRVCSGDAVERGWREHPRHVVAAFIHEILHTLGLGENPPPSAYITERVLSRCQPQAKGNKEARSISLAFGRWLVGL